MSDLKKSVVRIWDGAGKIVGAGFLVDDRHILTCDHVARRATVGTEANAEGAASVLVDFPLLPTPSPPMRATVRQLPAVEDRPLDVAGLRLEETVPTGAEPVRLVTSDAIWGHKFRALGFPSGRDRGEYATGRLLDAVAGDWVQIEAVAAKGARVRQGYSGTPLWDEVLKGTTGMVVAADKEDRDRIAYVIPATILVQAWSEVLASRSIPPCPYRGLEQFGEQDFDAFFGREAAADALVDRVHRTPVTCLVAASGTGKSSLLAAGLIPKLRIEGEWLAIPMRPGRDPDASLAFAMANAMHEVPDAAAWTRSPAELQQIIGQQPLWQVFSELMTQTGCRKLLLVVDQFEELVTLCRDVGKRVDFVTLLADLLRDASRSGGTARSVVAIRSDYERELRKVKGIAALLDSSTIRLSPMDDSSLREAIERPAADLGVTFEEGLIERILADFRGRPNALPLLQFLLLLLWERQEKRMFTESAYLDLGGVDGALSRHADDAFDRLTDEEQRRARRVLMQLVGLAEGSPDARRPLCEHEVRPGDWEIVEQLAGERLLFLDESDDGDDVAELAHEALLWGWPRLQQWVAEADTRLKASDAKADALVKRFALGAGVANLLPPPADKIAVGATCYRMGQQIAEAYDCSIDREVMRTAGISMAQGVLAVTGAVWGGTSLAKWIPGGGLLVGMWLQPPLVAAIAYAVASTWKYYFHVVSEGGRGPDNAEVREFVKVVLRNNLRKADLAGRVSAPIRRMRERGSGRRKGRGGEENLEGVGEDDTI